MQSGSSGVPKGVVLEHGQLGTSLIGQAAAWGTKETCRFLQFSSLAYDAYVAEVWGAFLAGACLCMPSDHDRMNDLTGACRAMRITTACLTPTVARSLEFSKIPTFETLVIIGEPLTRADMENWANRVQLFSVYGITEASLGTSRTAQLSPSSPSNMLGNPYSGAFWVVDIDDSNRLAPVGAVGELIIESPSIARGYLDTTTLGDKSPFIRCPDWLEVMFPGRSDRVYKSGDLVRNTSDNALEYIARKDTVTKINGQRIDLVDIQDCLKRELPRTVNAAVEVVQLDQGTPTLAAFLAWKDTGAIHCGVLKDTDESTRLMLLGFKLARALHQKLPRHSVPSVFIPVCIDRFPCSLN